ncbi:MAG: hypothetical protein ACOY33_10280 [Pseudomonadota bacterium]
MEMSIRIDELLELANAISRGEVPKYQHNECYTAGAYDLLLIGADAPTAYALLVEACKRFESLEATGGSMDGYYYLLLLLANRANATEMPPEMPTIISAHPELALELRQWYRCGG